ncbi:MAG: hypothetical protein M1827_000095 [Pycnora praestabilis]|nr:MAG: hypothetical protein M1827_000095 [Pycnora praestabilis]
MPAMLDDPTAPVIYRTSGEPPYPTPQDNAVPEEIVSRQVTLRDRVTIATLIPFSSSNQVPPSLLSYLSDQLNREIEKGDTYPMIAHLPLSSFGPYWFQNFGAVMLLGDIESSDDLERMEAEGKDWEKECLGSFYIKPNYPGRSSHVCNGGFLVTDAARNRGVGRLMGEGYLEWAPKLGYTYSIFNLVYETNVASCRIWDALGFKRVGRVKGCGNLRSYPSQLIDAIIYGRDLGPEGEDFVSEERFDKIRFYLKHGKYPNGADRAEKSRLRSAATHYKLIPGDAGGEGNERLMLKDKEVVADPQRQYEIARQVHLQQHGGINKTTATIAEKYHWVRIKETVSLVIKNCVDCKEMAKAPVVRADGVQTKRPSGSSGQGGVSAAGRILSLPRQQTGDGSSPNEHASPGLSPSEQDIGQYTPHSQAPVANMQDLHDYSDMPLDPQIMEDVRQHLTHYNQNSDVPFSPDQTGSHESGPNHHISGSRLSHDHHSDHHTDYQALLDIDQSDPTSHQHSSDSTMIHHEPADEDNETMALKATATARAAQDAMGGIESNERDEDRDMEIGRQLMVAGFGGTEDHFHG